ncbi:MAG: LysR family transcriptional regulator [Pseudomonadota bacterium]
MRHLRLYRAIRLIRRTGSIRKAAEALSVSHSALNRALLGFEEELGVPLFDRVAGGVRLSTAGEHLMQIVDTHLNAFDDFQTLVSDMRGGLMGALRLSIASELMTGRMPEVLAAFQADAPRVGLEVLVSDTTARLRSHEVDLAIVTLPGTDDRVEVLLSHRSPLVARTGGTPIGQVSDLAGYRLILPPEGSGSRAVADHMIRAYRLAPEATAAFAGLWPTLATAPRPEAQILPAMALPHDAATPGIVRLGEIQIAIMRRRSVPLTRPAQILLTRMQATLDMAEARQPDRRSQTTVRAAE